MSITSSRTHRVLLSLPLLGALATGCALEGPAEDLGEATGEAAANPDAVRDHVDISFAEAEAVFEHFDEAPEPAFVGDACGSHGDCIDGFCDAGVCASWLELGDACGGYGEQLPTTCGGDDVCVYMVTALPDHPGHCAPRCLVDEDCGDGMHCAQRGEGDVCLPD